MPSNYSINIWPGGSVFDVDRLAKGGITFYPFFYPSDISDERLVAFPDGTAEIYVLAGKRRYAVAVEESEWKLDVSVNKSSFYLFALAVVVRAFLFAYR